MPVAIFVLVVMPPPPLPVAAPQETAIVSVAAVPLAEPPSPIAAEAPSAADNIASGAAIAPTSATVPAAADDGDDIMVMARRSNAGDPAQAINVAAFNVTQAVDRAVVGPVASTFEHIVPSPVRSGMRNFLNNLHEPTNAINFLLQHKIGKFFETVARFAINTTVGVGGLIDVARRRPFNLPRRRNSFANTFGFYGIGPGPYLYLPLVGATSVRDLIGGGLDSLAGPSIAGAPFNRPYYAIPTGALREIDNRIEFDATITRIRDDSVDPYTAARTEYLTRRHGEIEMLRCGRLDCHAPITAAATTVPAASPPTPAAVPDSAASTDANAAPAMDTPPPRR